jgi:PAS domain S-box-containing protein
MTAETAPARAEGGSDALLESQARVLEMIVRARPLPEVLEALCRIVESHASREVRAAILLVGPEGRRLWTGAAPSLPDAYCRAIDGIEMAPALGTCCAAAARGQVVITPSIAEAPSWRGLCSLPLGLGLKAAWSMPIVDSQQRVLGTFGTYFLEPGEPLPEERRLVSVLAPTAALAIERRRADDAVGAGARRDRFLAALGETTRHLLDPAEVMATTARMLAEHLEADRCAYAEVENEELFSITGDHPRGVPSIVGRWPIAAFGPACERLMRQGHPYVVTDVDEHPEVLPEHREAYRATRIQAVICVPLHEGGKLTAALAVHQAIPRVWTGEEIDLVALVALRCREALARARVERALRDSEARHRAIIEATPDCVMTLAPDGAILQMNAAGLRMIEAADERQAIGRNVYDLVAPEHREAFRRFNERVCRGEGGSVAFDLVGRDDTRRSMESAAVALPAPHGGFNHLAVARDVSARVAADRALAESRARLDYAVRLSGVGFWYCDLPFSVLHWDDRVKEHFFLPPEASVTIDLFYDRIHPEDRQPTRTAIDTSIQTRRPYDVVYRTCDPLTGAVRWVRALGGTAYAADGTPIRFDGVTVDVTALREQDRRKDEFLAMLAHELRNPLAPIRTGLQLLGRTTDPAQMGKTRAAMERQVEHLVRLVDDLLDISRITLGKLTLKKDRVDLQVALRSALEATAPLVRAAGHTLEVNAPEGPLLVDADPTRVAQVLANLVNNAAKYTPAGGRITIDLDEDGDDVVIAVSDTGIGIPASLIGRVFDLFTQGDHTADRAQGGLGVGLSLVRRLIELHGGSVTAASAGLGRGSTFTVRLPRAAAGARRPIGAGATAASPVAPLRILVVDDNVDAAESLAALLTLGGHQTRLAHCGETAIALTAEFRPDVVFLDIGLPGLNGYEVARRVRGDTSLEQPYLVALTGWGSSEDKRQAHAAGFDRHVVKPVDPAQLDQLLGRVRPAA